MATIETTYRMQDPETERFFEPDGPLPERHDDVWSEALTGEYDGAFRRVSWLVPDYDYRGDMIEWADPDRETNPNEWSNGCFRDFRNSHDGGGEIARDAFIEQMVEMVGADRVFIVDVYSHGLEHFSVSNSRWYPDRQWDVAPACVLAVPPDVTNPREWADGMMEQWTAVVNGDTWLLVSNFLDSEGNVIPDASEVIGGFIGREYAERCAKSGNY